GEGDIGDDPAVADAAEVVRLFALFADAARTPIVRIDLVVGPDFVSADLRVARRSAGGGQHIQLIRRAAGQVHTARDQVLRLGALEAERVGAERVRQRAQFAVARVLVRFEHQVERATKCDLGLVTFARGGGGGRLTGTGNRRQ